MRKEREQNAAAVVWPNRSFTPTRSSRILRCRPCRRRTISLNLPKLAAGTLCLIAVSLLSLYNGTLAKHLLDAMQQAQSNLSDHQALLEQVRRHDPGLARRLLAVIQQHQLDRSGQQALVDQVRRLDHYGLMVVWVFLAKGIFAFGQVYLISNVAQRLATSVADAVSAAS